MKKINQTIAGCVLMIGFAACSDSGTSANTTTTTSDTSTSTTSNTAATDNGTGNPAETSPRTPLSAQDSTFVMKAAMGGMMEVELGQLAEKNGSSPAVKNFGKNDGY